LQGPKGDQGLKGDAGKDGAMSLGAGATCPNNQKITSLKINNDGQLEVVCSNNQGNNAKQGRAFGSLDEINEELADYVYLSTQDILTNDFVLSQLIGPRGEQGIQGEQGVAGKSALQIWQEQNNSNASVSDFLSAIKGPTGDSAYQTWLALPGNENKSSLEFINQLKGAPGNAGEAGFDGSDGKDGKDGESAYEIWLAAGNQGTPQQFLDSLRGSDGVGTPGSAGEKGDKGDPGEKGEKGDPGEKGEMGEAGAPGRDGVVSVEGFSESAICVANNGNISWGACTNQNQGTTRIIFLKN
jgi:hypothetical protein